MDAATMILASKDGVRCPGVVGPRAVDGDWFILREFYCPGCGIQLEVEAVPPGHPFIFDAQLDIDSFYAERPALKRKVFKEDNVSPQRIDGENLRGQGRIRRC